MLKWSRYRPGVAQRVVRGIALLFHDRGTRRGWVVSSTPRPHFTSGKNPVPILQEAGWAPGSVWTGGKSRPHRDSIPHRPARSQSLYWVSYRAHSYRQSIAQKYCYKRVQLYIEIRLTSMLRLFVVGTRIKNRQDVISRYHKLRQTMTTAFTMWLVGTCVKSDHYWLWILSIATRYELQGPGSDPGGGEIIRKLPDQTWGPISLLYNGYRVFPGGKANGAWRWPPTSIYRQDKRKNIPIIIPDQESIPGP